jgi:periplasmic divalent cation tolerance protein
MDDPPVASDIRTVLVTAPDLGTAESLAGTLVDERLVACANLVPGVVSIYRWKGEVHRDDEVLLVLKTTVGRSEALRARVVALHPHEIPEVLVLAVDEGHEPYQAWVREQVEVSS